MTLMATGCSMLEILSQRSMDAQMDSINRMVATMPSIVTYWYKFSHDGEDISLVNDEDTMAGHFFTYFMVSLRQIFIGRSWMLLWFYMLSIEFNASTFC